MALELFHPDRSGVRSWAWGHYVADRKAEEAIDKKSAWNSLAKIRTDSFTIEDISSDSIAAGAENSVR